MLFINFFLATKLIKFILEKVKQEQYKVITLNAETSFFFILLLALYLTFICHIPYFIKLFLKHKDIFYQEEKKIIYWSILTIPIGLIGSFFSFYVVVNMILPFFMTFNQMLGIENIIGFSQLIQLIVVQGIVFFLFFQIPLIIKFLIYTKIITKQKLNNRKFRLSYLLFISIVSSWITPPDPMSMLLVLIPLYLCLEVGLLIS